MPQTSAAGTCRSPAQEFVPTVGHHQERLLKRLRALPRSSKRGSGYGIAREQYGGGVLPRNTAWHHPSDPGRRRIFASAKVLEGRAACLTRLARASVERLLAPPSRALCFRLGGQVRALENAGRAVFFHRVPSEYLPIHGNIDSSGKQLSCRQCETQIEQGIRIAHDIRNHGAREHNGLAGERSRKGRAERLSRIAQGIGAVYDDDGVLG